MGVRIRERDGAWWVYVCHKGRRRAKRVGSKDAAKELKTRLEKRLAAGDLRILEKPGITFAQAAKQWLESYVKPHLKPRTHDLYALVATKYLVPAFGPTPLRALSRGQLREALAGWHAKALSPRYVHTIGAALSGILSQAVEDGHIEHNPAARLGRYAPRQQEPAEGGEPVKYWTGEQVGRILARTRQEYPEWHDLFTTLAWAALRIGEGLGLRWEDLDLPDRVLHVRRSVDHEGGTVRPALTKGNRGRRVELPERLAALLADRQSRIGAEAAAAGRAPSPWVFPHRDGQPMRYPAALKVLDYILDLEKIPRYDRVMMHAFRHSWATLTLQNATTPAAILYVSRQLGHASVKITLDVYAHLIPEENRHLAELAVKATGAGMQLDATPAQPGAAPLSELLDIPAASPHSK